MGQAARTLDAISGPSETKTTTLLDLVVAVAAIAETEAELVATVRHLINSGRVRLVGHFRGADVRVA